MLKKIIFGCGIAATIIGFILLIIDGINLFSYMSLGAEKSTEGMTSLMPNLLREGILICGGLLAIAMAMPRRSKQTEAEH